MPSSTRRALCTFAVLVGCGLAVAAQQPAEEKEAAAKPPTEEKKSGDEKKKKKPKDKSDKEKEKEKGKSKEEKKENKRTGAAEAEPPGTGGRISLPALVIGYPAKQLKIPYYDTAGNLQMIFTIGVATRQDADHVNMDEMQVETYNEEGEPEMTIDLPASVLDVNTRIITSATKTTIKREDFVITGDSVRFDTKTKQGTLVGNVHMTVYDINEEAPAVSPAPPNEQ